MLLFTIILFTNYYLAQCKKDSSSSGDNDLGNRLADSLKNEANLDLPIDEEYEDLRAEFLAYRTALASLTSSNTRRSLVTTPCWRQNGICINHELCVGFKSLSQVPGCKDKLKVCCFVWAKYNVRDHKPFGIGNLAMPWSLHKEFGGLGVLDKNETKLRLSKKNKKKASRSRALAFIIRTL